MGNSSFDVTTGVDLQEVDNAVNQTMKEVITRYDFKGTDCTVEMDREVGALKLEADDDYRMTALFDILQGKLVKRKVPLSNLDIGENEEASGGRARKKIGLKQGIDADTARKIVKDVKAQKMKKVQISIQGEELRPMRGLT